MKVLNSGSIRERCGRRKNLFQIVHQQHGQLIVVVSAMGKTTNLLETLCNAYFHWDSESPRHHERIKRLSSKYRDLVVPFECPGLTST